jgi:hypothetical protein
VFDLLTSLSRVKASALTFAEFSRVAADQVVLIVDFVLGVDVKLVA